MQRLHFILCEWILSIIDTFGVCGLQIAGEVLIATRLLENEKFEKSMAVRDLKAAKSEYSTQRESATKRTELYQLLQAERSKVGMVCILLMCVRVFGWVGTCQKVWIGG